MRTTQRKGSLRFEDEQAMTAEQLKVHESEFCPAVVSPVRQDWMLQDAGLDILRIKQRHKTADPVQEYYS